MYKKVFVISTLLLLQACASTKGYEGDVRDKSELAIIYSSEMKKYDGGKEFVLIEHINEIEVGNDMVGWPKKVETLPGEIKIKVKFDTTNFGKALVRGLGAGLGGAVGGAMSAAATNGGARDELIANVEKGKVYRINFSTESHTVGDLKMWLEPYTPPQEVNESEN